MPYCSSPLSYFCPPSLSLSREWCRCCCCLFDIKAMSTLSCCDISNANKRPSLSSARKFMQPEKMGTGARAICQTREETTSLLLCCSQHFVSVSLTICPCPQSLRNSLNLNWQHLSDIPSHRAWFCSNSSWVATKPYRKITLRADAREVRGNESGMQAGRRTH